MTKIGLLSDTHGSLPRNTFEFFGECQQIWHAGDIGDMKVAEQLERFRPLKAVYGNIDGAGARSKFQKTLLFQVEKVKVLMTHIGGYPGRYTKDVLNIIREEKPDLFVSGHSHILKVMFDKNYRLLHINPGAAGNYGLHQKITMVRFVIDGSQISDLEIFEKNRNGLITDLNP